MSTINLSLSLSDEKLQQILAILIEQKLTLTTQIEPEGETEGNWKFEKQTEEGKSVFTPTESYIEPEPKNLKGNYIFQPQINLTQTDSAGVVYDEKIHSSTRSKNVDGTWRTKRGYRPPQVAAVQQPVVAPQVAAVQQPVVAPQVTQYTFDQLISDISRAMTEGKIVPDTLIFHQQIKGLKNIYEIRENPQAILEMKEALKL